MYNYGIAPISRIIPNEALATAPTTGYANGIIMTAPSGDNSSIDIFAIEIGSYQAVVDGTDAVTLAIKVVDDDGTAVATLVSAFDLETVTAKNGLSVWTGKRRLTAGQSLLFEVTATSPDTAGFGYCLTVSARIAERSGDI